MTCRLRCMEGTRQSILNPNRGLGNPAAETNDTSRVIPTALWRSRIANIVGSFNCVKAFTANAPRWILFLSEGDPNLASPGIPSDSHHKIAESPPFRSVVARPSRPTKSESKSMDPLSLPDFITTSSPPQRRSRPCHLIALDDVAMTGAVQYS